MLDRVCTEILGLNGGGRVGQYVNCAQWQSAQRSNNRTDKTEAKKDKSKKSKKRVEEGGLTASEKNELADMEATIQKAEDRVTECQTATEDPTIGSDHEEVQKRWEALEAAKAEVTNLYARWEELEAKAT